MKQYELAVLLHPDLEIDLKPPLERVEEMLKSFDASIVKRDDWGKRKLAYPIKKQGFAVYFFYLIELAPSKVDELEAALRLNDEVLRHMVVTYEPPIEDSSDDEKRKETKEEKDGS